MNTVREARLHPAQPWHPAVADGAPGLNSRGHLKNGFALLASKQWHPVFEEISAFRVPRVACNPCIFDF